MEVIFFKTPGFPYIFVSFPPGVRTKKKSSLTWNTISGCSENILCGLVIFIDWSSTNVYIRTTTTEEKLLFKKHLTYNFTRDETYEWNIHCHNHRLRRSSLLSLTLPSCSETFTLSQYDCLGVKV